MEEDMVVAPPCYLRSAAAALSPIVVTSSTLNPLSSWCCCTFSSSSSSRETTYNGDRGDDPPTHCVASLARSTAQTSYFHILIIVAAVVLHHFLSSSSSNCDKGSDPVEECPHWDHWDRSNHPDSTSSPAQVSTGLHSRNIWKLSIVFLKPVDCEKQITLKKPDVSPSSPLVRMTFPDSIARDTRSHFREISQPVTRLLPHLNISMSPLELLYF